MAWTRRKKYRYKNYTKIETDRQKKVKRLFKRIAVATVVIVLLLAAVISAGEYFGLNIPSWNDIYAAAGITQSPPVQGDAAQSATKVHFIDVGQADATLIEQNGHFALIDAGVDESSSNGSGALVSYLDSAGVKTIDVLVVTHQHYDHIGALPDVLAKYDVKQVVMVDTSKAPPFEGYTFSRVTNLIQGLKIPCDTAEAGKSYAVGDGTLTVLFAGIDITEDDYNNISVVTMFEAEGMRFLSCGDADTEEETALVQSGANIKANLYKAAHHGASTSNYYTFLQNVKPQIAVVSCGLNNSFGHPQPRAVQAFEDLNVTMLRTDKQGTVVVYVDENSRLAYAETGKLAA